MDIDYVARLARISLSDKEKEKYSRQLADILRYIEKLNRLNTDNVEPTAHVMHIKNVWRKDEVRQSIDFELLGNIMPKKKDRFFEVPPVIE